MAEETRAAVRGLESRAESRALDERRDRVLIVEDEDNARRGYEQLLQRWGCETLGVATAEDALAKFASYQPDSIIADVELPGMNGLDLLKQLGDELLDVIHRYPDHVWVFLHEFPALTGERAERFRRRLADAGGRAQDERLAPGQLQVHGLLPLDRSNSKAGKITCVGCCEAHSRADADDTHSKALATRRR